MSAKFKIDGRVEFVAGFGSPPGQFRIIRELPSERDEPSYRLKGEHEAFERVARESQLRRVVENLK
ncbi:hypothetical protein [Aquabacter cavernae]|uniref:hypothetical protein n=1 Tax=Aquabacter cavernae TaxID=2496029 RepID=UPI000F8DEB7C|nr:hypothetical protein [Aquabacter cavernae]